MAIRANAEESESLIESSTSRDSEELNVLASRFGATEYELFGLAFYDAHGYKADACELQVLFMEFLQSGAAPAWLRSYVRNRFTASPQQIDNIKESALIKTGSSSALVKWRSSVDVFSFTLVSELADTDYASGE